MTEVLSYGGGIQSVAMCVLAAKGNLPRPDRIVFADTGREVDSTARYIDDVMTPYLSEFGLSVEIAPHSLSTVDIYAKNGDMLIPAFTETGKLPTFCSSEWKQRVIQRYLRSQGYTSANVWIGFSTDEARRAKSGDYAPWNRSYPLIDAMLSRVDCRIIIESAGLPAPKKSRCWCCPHQSDAEWADLSPVDLAAAVALDTEIRDADDRGALYLHPSRKPLKEVRFRPSDDSPAGQCSLGLCFL